MTYCLGVCAMSWPDTPPIILMMAHGRPAKTCAERARDSRERWRVRRRLALALREVDRIGDWDEADRIAIDRACDQLLMDWCEAVTRDGDDPVPRATIRKVTERESED